MAETSQQSEYGSDIEIMLIGKSGHGKSSTGNSILGHDCFESRGGATSVTQTYQIGYDKIEGRVLKVVDIPGICDTEKDSKTQQEKLVIDAVSDGIKRFPEGFNALLLVLSYQARLTQEELNTIKALKTLLGEDILRQHTVLVFTHGDDFWHDFRGKTTFQTWIGQQCGNLKDLIVECESRVVLFDNRTVDESKQNAQRKELVAMIDSLKGKQTTYTVHKLEFARHTREEKEREIKCILLSEEYSKELGLIKADISKIQLYSPDVRDERLLQIKEEVTHLVKKLSEETHERFTPVKTQVDDMLNQIATLEFIFNEQREERIRHEQIEAEKIKLEEEIRQSLEKQEKMAQDVADAQINAMKEKGELMEQMANDNQRHHETVLEQERVKAKQQETHMTELKKMNEDYMKRMDELDSKETKTREALEERLRNAERRLEEERDNSSSCVLM